LPGVIPSPSQVSPKEPITLLRRTVGVANNRHTLRHLGPGDANRGFRCGPFSTLLRQPARLQLVSGRSVGLVAEQPQPSIDGGDDDLAVLEAGQPGLQRREGEQRELRVTTSSWPPGCKAGSSRSMTRSAPAFLSKRMA
jgi:hypothetical protein